MSVGPISWTILALIVLFLIGLDFAGHVRNPHPPALKESLAWTIGYIGLALIFGLIVWVTNGGVYAAEFYGKGFQGAVKRYGQHRGPMAHGSKFHRHQGSNGSTQVQAVCLRARECQDTWEVKK